MDEKIITCLKMVQEGRDRKGAIHYTYPKELPEGYTKSNIDYYRKLGLLRKEGNVLHLTPLGYEVLNNARSLEVAKSSQKVNQEMLKHTESMKRLTILILILTALNVLFMIIQICLLLK